MLGRVAALLSGLALFACTAVGGPAAPEPGYTVTAKLGVVEIRQYGPRIAAETVVAGDEVTARNDGVGRLTGYVSGGNQSGAKVAMSAPVAQAQESAGSWRIRLFMPPGSTLQTLPQPDDHQITLATIPPETLAVLRFSDVPTGQAVADNTGKLVAALEGTAWRPAGEPVAWFYDLPSARPPVRNEVAIPVSPN